MPSASDRIGILHPGDRIADWVVDHPVGFGGMALVYHCHHVQSPDRVAAIKLLDRRVAGQARPRARFAREAQILQSLDHPNIVEVRDVDLEHVPPFIEMEYVDGESLRHHLQAGRRLAPRTAVHVALQVARALAYLHEREIYHRDVKPDNVVVLPTGEAKLVDFGLALDPRLDRITQADLKFGTVSYAPPEWADDGPMDPTNWDIYGLGLVLCEALTGVRAFPTPAGTSDDRRAAFAVMAQKQAVPFVDPGPDLPAGLRVLCQSLTHADPSRRPASAAAVVKALATLDLAE